MSKRWLAIARTCSSCGGGAAVLVLDEEPENESVLQTMLRAALGGMWCIDVQVIRLSEDGPTVFKGRG